MKKRYDKPLTPTQIAAIKDDDIDFSDIPPLDQEFWKTARVRWSSHAKKQLTMRLDADIVDWFKSQGKGYQTRMNAVLRSFYESRRDLEE